MCCTAFRGTPGLVGAQTVPARRPGLDEERVRVPVIAPVELDDPVAARRRPRQADGAHRRLGPGADEAHPLDRRHQRPHLLGEAAPRSGRRAAIRRRRARRRSMRLERDRAARGRG